ncbi:MAG: lytic transglycosylase domain-containing protein [Pseudomonadota bacterium]
MRALARTLLLTLAIAAGAPVAGAADAPQADPKLRELLIDAVGDAQSFNDRFDAEVWLVDMSARLKRKVPDDEERLELLKLVHSEAKRADLPPELVLAVIDIESNFDRFAISYAGALGMMQIMPFWLDEIGRPDDNLFHVPTNLRMGCTILRYYIDMEDGNLATGLARYNGSYGRRTYSDKVLNRLRQRWYKR